MYYIYIVNTNLDISAEINGYIYTINTYFSNLVHLLIDTIYMLYTKSLLNTFIDIQTPVDEIADQLTLRTCEVEETTSRTLPDLLVVWYVTACEPHHDSKKLSVCQVDAWPHGQFQICCGASNVAADMYVATALPGCHLPAIDLTIWSRQLGGVDSNGMICSKSELGIQEDLDVKGIRDITQHVWKNPQKALWTSLYTLLPYIQTRTIDVENKTITHRPDMRGHFWYAVEIAAIAQQKWRDITTTQLFDSMLEIGKDTSFVSELKSLDRHDIPVTVTADACDIYGSIYIDIWDTWPQQSDLATRLQLLDLGLAPRSHRVDQSNLRMYTTWHPVHFFDADMLDWWLTIRYAVQGEEFIDLFDKKHILQDSDIVIADESKICALAGIVWSHNSGITESTTKILIECAHFDPVVVRKTATRLGLRTEAELRFEKNISPYWTLCNIYMMYSYLQENDVTIYGTQTYMSKDDSTLVFPHIPMNLDTAFGQISPDFDASKRPEVDQILSDLWYTYTDGQVIVPGWRWPDDVTIPADIVEEVSRMYGFDRIWSEPLYDTAKYVPYTDDVYTQRTLEILLADRLGMYQMETYPWTSDQQIADFAIDTSSLIPMHNSVTADQNYLRSTMYRSVFAMITTNAAFHTNFSVFDIWQVWRDGEEKTSLGVAIRVVQSKNWKDAALLQAKSTVDQVLSALPVKGRLQYRTTTHDLYHPHQQWDIYLNNQHIWSVSRIHAYTLEQHKMNPKDDVVLLELDLTKLIQMMNQQKKPWLAGASTYQTNQDHIIYRDLSFVIWRDAAIGDIVTAIRKIKQVGDVDIFDIYAGEHVTTEQKSVAIKFSVVSSEALTTEEINNIMDSAIANVKKVGGELRG